MVYSVEKRITQICAYNLVPHLSPYEKPTCQSDGQVLTVHTVFRLSARKTEHAKLDIKSSNIVKQPKTISHHHIFTEDLHNGLKTFIIQHSYFDMIVFAIGVFSV